MLRAGGNAVDAALAAMLTSFAAEPLLTGLGAGGYMLVARAPAGEPVLLDFFVEAPGRGADHARRAELVPVDVSFGDAVQVFNVGAGVGRHVRHAAPASATAARALRARAAGRARRARRRRSRARASPLNAQQAYVVEILGGIVTLTPEVRGALRARGARCCARASASASRSSATRSSGSGREGARPFYEGDIAAAVRGAAGRAGRAADAPRTSPPTRRSRASRCAARYRGREVLTNPPPSAGGMLIALRARRCSTARDGPPSLAGARRGDGGGAGASARRSSSTGLDEAGFAERFLAVAARLDDAHLGARRRRRRVQRDLLERRGRGDRRARHGDPPQQHAGRAGPQPARLPPLSARAADAEHDGADGGAARRRARARARQRRLEPHPLGDPADDRRRRRPRHARPARRCARRACTSRTASSTPSRASTSTRWRPTATRSRASARCNLFFGGVQAVERDAATGALSGGGDPRRGGAAVVA